MRFSKNILLKAKVPYRSFCALIVAFMLGLVLLPTATYAKPGDIDPTFGYTKGNWYKLNKIKVQADGKLLINLGYNSQTNEFEGGLTRLNIDGTIDTSFAFNTDTYQVLDFQALPNGNIGALVQSYTNNPTNFEPPHLLLLDSQGHKARSCEVTYSPYVENFYMQPDGSAWLAGSFSRYLGNASYDFLARSAADCQMDYNFPHTFTADSSRFGAGQNISFILSYAGGKYLAGGNVTGLVRLNADGTKDTSFNVSPVYSTFARPFTVVSTAAAQQDGKILIAGVFNRVNDTPRNGIARLNADGSLDTSFDAAITFNNATLQPPASIVVQPDGKIIVGGDFTSVNGQNIKSLVRLNADGTLDTSFVSPLSAANNDQVQTVVLLDNGKILLGGDFKSPQGAPDTREVILRLESNGTVDTTFKNYNTVTKSLVNGEVKLVTVQPDDKILISGSFTQVDGLARPGLARLNANSSLDPTFQPTQDYQASALALQPSGKVLVAKNGSNIVRLTNDGTLDGGFPNIAIPAINALAVQADGKFLVGSANDASRLARYTADGALDPTFNVQLTGSNGAAVGYYRVTAILVQADGKIVIAGVFDFVNGQARKGLARLNADGSLDTTFVPSQNVQGIITKIVPSTNGKVLVAGTGLVLNTTKNIARLNTDGSLDSGFAPIELSEVQDLNVQPDGKFILACLTTNQTYRLLRFNADGTLDNTFYRFYQPSDKINSLGLQSNWRIVFGGNFKFFNYRPFPSLQGAYLARYLNQAPTSVTLTTSKSSITYNESVTLMTALNFNDTTGNVTFKDGTKILGTAAVNNGQAMLTVNNLLGGSHSLTAQYNGDDSYLTSTSPSVTFTVNKATPSVTVTGSDAPILLGQEATFEAVVIPGDVVGSVTFKDGATVLGTVNLDANRAVFRTSQLSAGMRSITAEFNGDNNYNQVVSTPIIQEVVNNQVTLSSSAAYAQPGSSVVMTANINPSTATGSIKFNLGETIVANVPLVNGVATYTTSTVGIGLYEYKAAYSGDGTFTPSVSQAFQQRFVQACAAGVSPAQVTAESDDGTATICGTFSFALGQARPLGSNEPATITASLPNGSRTINFTGKLTLPMADGLVLDGGECGTPALVLNGNSVAGDALRLMGHNLVQNIQIKGFSGRGIVTKGYGNRLVCVAIIKS